MKILNKKNLKFFFNSKNGVIFGSFAWLIALCSFTIAIILYLKVDPSYSIFTHHLSDLGAGENFSNIVFFIGLAFSASFQIPFYISIGISLKQKKGNWNLIRIAMGASIISSLSLILIIPFLSDPDNPISNNLHGFLGFTHFSAMVVAYIFYSIIELTNPKISNLFGLISILSALFYSLAIIFVTIRIFYWIAILGIFLWVFMHTIFLIRTK
ncbi:MAG: hypothetical protein ACFE8M_01145 [Candidatus Hermodarchaeota archaeon]